jgi:hypothetical protein
LALEPLPRAQKYEHFTSYVEQIFWQTGFCIPKLKNNPSEREIFSFSQIGNIENLKRFRIYQRWASAILVRTSAILRTTKLIVELRTKKSCGTAIAKL